MIPWLAKAHFAVLNGLCGTVADAGHAVCAVLSPDGLSVLQRLCPIKLVCAAKDPPAVIFTFEYEDTFLMDHQQINFGSSALIRDIDVFQNDKFAGEIMVCKCVLS